jgi:hypothetical protein
MIQAGISLQLDGSVWSFDDMTPIFVKKLCKRNIQLEGIVQEKEERYEELDILYSECMYSGRYYSLQPTAFLHNEPLLKCIWRT